jgi:hypothetical protein
MVDTRCPIPVEALANDDDGVGMGLENLAPRRMNSIRSDRHRG